MVEGRCDMAQCMRCGKPLPEYLCGNIAVCPNGCDGRDLQKILDSCSGRDKEKSKMKPVHSSEKEV